MSYFFMGYEKAEKQRRVSKKRGQTNFWHKKKRAQEANKYHDAEE